MRQFLFSMQSTSSKLISFTLHYFLHWPLLFPPLYFSVYYHFRFIFAFAFNILLYFNNICPASFLHSVVSGKYWISFLLCALSKYILLIQFLNILLITHMWPSWAHNLLCVFRILILALIFLLNIHLLLVFEHIRTFLQLGACRYIWCSTACNFHSHGAPLHNLFGFFLFWFWFLCLVSTHSTSGSLKCLTVASLWFYIYATPSRLTKNKE